MANVILRPVYNRPEMLRLSLEYEIMAREHYMLPGRFITVFLVEYGTPQSVIDMTNNYPYESFGVFRQQKFGLTINILEGMKDAFGLADDYVIYIEDDILLHKTYFEYMDILLSTKNLGKFSVLSPFNQNDSGNVKEVYRGHHYAALAPLITKEFHSDYILPCSSDAYYKNPPSFVMSLNKKYEKYFGKGYKYNGTTTHYEQAGMLNRLVDAAMLDQGKYVIMPRVNRQQHIGYFGKNRPGGIIPGKTFDERLENLREIILDADKMYQMSATKQYNDYRIFSPKLDEWDGKLYVK